MNLQRRFPKAGKAGKDRGMQLSQTKRAYLELLSKTYRNEDEASSEIINLTAIQNLPKGTEHFISDIHGEYEAFLHILKNASGVIRLKIDDAFGDSMTEQEKRRLAVLIYYPAEKLEIIRDNEPDMEEFYYKTLHQLIEILYLVTKKYSRSYVRKQIPQAYAYIIEELLYGASSDEQKKRYQDNLITGIVEIGKSEDFIIIMSELISRLAVYHLHVLGDVFDRGPGGDIVLEALTKYHSVDIQWGNHDILWMGAAAGNTACIANVIRICTRYDNLHTLEVGYGISIRPLVTFALEAYAEDPCQNFNPKVSTKDALYASDVETLKKICKAIAIIQFKLEGQLIKKHPSYDMESLRLLHKIDFETYTVEVDGKRYPLNNRMFPTIDPEDPYRLTDMEQAVIDRLQSAFLESEALQAHVRFLFSKGSIYKCYNGNLLFHGCVPMEEDGTLSAVETEEGLKTGKDWFDYAEETVRKGYFGKAGTPGKQRCVDFFWYLWCGYQSPLFGKKKITTFERCFIEDENTWKEAKNPYYSLVCSEEVVDMIAENFGLSKGTSHIINGHMPVKKGTNPLKANGRVFLIDGGFAKPYQKTTGIAGYSLTHNSYGYILTAHEAFESAEVAVREEKDILSTQVAQENIKGRLYNRDTDMGKDLAQQIYWLKLLLEAYRNGLIREKM